MKIKIAGKEVKFFTKGVITLKLDSIASTFEFITRFDPESKEQQEMWKPLQYKTVEFYNSKEKLVFTGTLLNHVFKSSENPESLAVSGYSKSGILEDSVVPVKDYPLESNGRSLLEIATRLCGLYNLPVRISKSVSNLVNSPIDDNSTLEEKTDFESLKAKGDSVFGRTSAAPTDTVKDYLAKICSQKNVILSHNQKGEVLLFQPNYNQKPKYFFDDKNTLQMTASFNGQALHSEISVLRQPSDVNQGVESVDTIKNYLVNLYRPTTKILSSGEDTDTIEAARNELANELKAIRLTLKLQGIYDDLFPGEIVNVHNHEIYSYAFNRFMVESIDLQFDEREDVTLLNLLVPEAFNGSPNIKNILYNHLGKDNHL